MDALIEALKNWWPQIIAAAGILGTICGTIGTIWYRRKSVRQRQQLIEIGKDRGKRRVELTHTAFQEWKACAPPLLQARIVVRNLSERQEVITAVFLDNNQNGSSQVFFEGRHKLAPHDVLELSAEREMPKELPTRFLIQLVDGKISGELKDETTSHGVFPTYTPEQMAALATGDFKNPAHPFNIPHGNDGYLPR